MSDMFDHEEDAWASYDQYYDGLDCSDYDCYERNTLYYHDRVIFSSVFKETDKAICLLELKRTGNTPTVRKLWIPKKLIKEFSYDNKSCYVHKRSLEDIIQNKTTGLKPR